MKRNDAETVSDEARNEANEGGRFTSQGIRKGGEPINSRRASRVYRQRGVGLAWTAVVLLALVGLMGLSIDYAKVVFNIHELQNAADGAALAGAQVVKLQWDSSPSRASALASGNYADRLPVVLQTDLPSHWLASLDPADWSAESTRQDGHDILVGRWIRQWADYASPPPPYLHPYPFVPTSDSPSAVRTVARRGADYGDGAPALGLLWGQVFSANTAGDVYRRAIAWARGSTGAGVLQLAANPASLPGWNHATGLVMDGGTVLDLRGTDFATGEPITGDIQVNSTSEGSPWAAFRLDGSSAEIWAGEFNVVGTTNPAPTATNWDTFYANTFPFSINPESPRIDDPLASVIPPDIATMPPGSDATGIVYYDPIKKTYTTITGGTLTLNPGYYPGGIQMTGGSLTLNPGVYAFGGGKIKNNGPGLVIGGNASLTANGVLLYITGDPTGKITGTKAEYGRLDLGGNGTIDITSRGDVLTPRQIDGDMGIAIWQDRANNNPGSITGTSLFRIAGTIYCGYNALDIGGTAGQTGNQLIAGALRIHGNPDIHIAYDGRNEVGAYRSVLVK